MRSMKDYEEAKKFAHPDQRFGCVTFAQHGDDLMILNLFNLMGITTPSYLDLGAHHPAVISNTALLYERGSRGVNVEANPACINAFKLHRPNDKTVEFGVGPRQGTFPFYIYGEYSGRNTFSLSEVESLQGRMKVSRTFQVTVLTVNTILENYCGGVWPDLLLTDLEGLDYEVLKSADFSKSKPKLIVTEARKDKSLEVRTLMSERDYILYCRMGENLFFVDKAFSHLVY